MKQVVIYHRADFDGIFCREIARKFLPEAELIGWDFGDAPVLIPKLGMVYVMDLPVDRVFGFTFGDKMQDMLSQINVVGDSNSIKEFNSRLIWIDHHKSSIETHPHDIPGYRIDGVAACRLAWQWFTNPQISETGKHSPKKEEFIDRTVVEPLAVRLAGEYDIWDKRDYRADTFQFGLRSRTLTDTDWSLLLESKAYESGEKVDLLDSLLSAGEILQRYQREQDASIVKRGFDVRFEGLNFLALNIARCNSLTFESAAQPQHDGLMGFYWNGKEWVVSLYHSPHHREHDLSAIAVKFGGGGHRGACGFRTDKLPFLK